MESGSWLASTIAATVAPCKVKFSDHTGVHMGGVLISCGTCPTSIALLYIPLHLEQYLNCSLFGTFRLLLNMIKCFLQKKPSAIAGDTK